jgi:uncharacterized membrane protein YeaQ/YmgE (transglycosylase-associated protein family)
LDPEERKLQIKLAQLNAILQVNLAQFFGAVAGWIAFLVFEYQLLLVKFPLLSPATIGVIGSIVAIVILSYISYKGIFQLLQCLKEFENLQ